MCGFVGVIDAAKPQLHEIKSYFIRITNFTAKNFGLESKLLPAPELPLEPECEVTEPVKVTVEVAEGAPEEDAFPESSVAPAV